MEGRLRRAGLMTAWRAFGAFAVDWLGLLFFDDDSTGSSLVNDNLKPGT